MRFIKLALISFVVFGGIILLMSLFMPSHVRISKAINIHPHQRDIFQWITNEEKWPLWHPAYQHKTGQEEWRKKQVVRLVTQNDSLLVMNISNPRGRTVRNSWQIHRFGASDSLTLQWYMDFYLRWYPWEKFSSLFYEGTYGKMMQQGLENLKNIEQGTRNIE